MRRKTFPSRPRRACPHRPCHKPRVVAVVLYNILFPSLNSETRGFVCVVRIRPSARLHARVCALARCVRDHSSLSRGHRRCGHEPLCSRSRRVVREVIHSFIHSFIHVARLVDRARDSFRGRVTPPLASRHLDERVDNGARDSSRRAVKTNRQRARKMRVRGAACFV